MNKKLILASAVLAGLVCGTTTHANDTKGKTKTEKHVNKNCKEGKDCKHKDGCHGKDGCGSKDGHTEADKE